MAGTHGLLYERGLFITFCSNILTIQGMVDGSASKPAQRQDTGYMVEKTYLDIAPYWGLLGPI